MNVPLTVFDKLQGISKKAIWLHKSGAQWRHMAYLKAKGELGLRDFREVSRACKI